MAQEDITAGLFADILPRSPQQDLALYQAQRDRTAATIAALEPGRGVVFSGVQAAQDVGRAIGEVGKGVRGLLGAESTQEMQDKLSEQIRAGGADILKTEGLGGYLNYLSDSYAQAGMTDKATKAKLVAERITQQQDTIKSTITKNLAAANKDKQASTLDQARQVVLQLAGRTDLGPQEQRVLANAREVLKLSTPGGTTINMTQESKFAGQRGELQAKALDAAALSASTARASLTTLDDLENLAKDNKLYTGPLAMTALGASNFLNSVGLLSAADARNLASAERYDKGAKDLVMQELGGKLGAQISDADRKFIEARIPQLTNSPTARLEIIQKLKDIQNGKINVYKRMNEYANKNNNLNDFDFSQSYMPPSIIAPQGAGTRENPIKL
jgi:hypothetical protein